MPYILIGDRVRLDNFIKNLSKQITTDGELNYVITSLIHDQLKTRGLKYQNINNLIGALECAKLELYRVVAGPYENIKMDVNGRVSELDEEFFKTQVK